MKLSGKNEKLFPYFIVFILLFPLLSSCQRQTDPGLINPTPTLEIISSITLTSGNSTKIPALQHTPPNAVTETTIIREATVTPIVKRIFDQSFSPDGMWIAEVSSLENRASMRVQSLIDTELFWVIPEIKQSGLRRIPQAFHWSSDGATLYYTYLPTYGDGCIGRWAWNGLGLYKLALESGIKTDITKSTGYWLAISPYEKKLAYLGSQHVSESDANVVIGVIDLITGDRVETEVETTYDPTTLLWPIDLVWSPDSKLLVFGLVVNPCEESINRYSIIKVNASTLKQTTLVNELINWYQPYEWKEIDKVVLRESNGQKWELNPNTGEITRLD